MACNAPQDTRAARNALAGERTLAEGLVVRVGGGAIVARETVEGGFKVTVRAQSLDVRVEVEDKGCQPRLVEITVSHLPPAADGVETRWRPFLGALSPTVAATRRALGGAVLLSGDADDPDWTPLAGAATFAPLLEPEVRVWTVETDRGQRAAIVHPRRIEDVERTARAGACATLGAQALGELGQAPVIARHRLRVPFEDRDVTFAVWGNTAGRSGTRGRILGAVALSGVDFAVVTGDLTAQGTRDQLEAAAAQIDAALEVPWFATLGNRDVQGEAGDDYLPIIGTSRFAFDAGPVRLAVVDSGDAALSGADHASLARWLGRKPLWWQATAAPPVSVVLTHVPPFDPFGARGAGFKSRLEATRVMALLQRARVPYLLTSNLAIWRTDDLAGVQVVHAGGGGAPLEDGTGDFFWLRVTARAGCVPVGTAGVALGAPCGDGCAGGSACVEGACAPCVVVERRDPLP